MVTSSLNEKSKDQLGTGGYKEMTSVFADQ